jgi:hypothetical protein
MRLRPHAKKPHLGAVFLCLKFRRPVHGLLLAESFFCPWFAATGVRQEFINAVPSAAKVLRVDWIYISFPAMKKATAAMPGGFGL